MAKKLKHYSNKELEEKINDSLHALIGGDKYIGLAAPIYLAEKSRRNTRKVSWATFLTAFLALIVASVAMWFSIEDYNSDKYWRHDQLSVLKEIRDNTKITFE